MALQRRTRACQTDIEGGPRREIFSQRGLDHPNRVIVSRRATNSMLGMARGGIGACTMSANITLVWLIVGSIYLMYLAGRIAEGRGRSFKVWAGIAAIIGPLAFPLIYLFPNLRNRNG